MEVLYPCWEKFWVWGFFSFPLVVFFLEASSTGQEEGATTQAQLSKHQPSQEVPKVLLYTNCVGFITASAHRRIVYRASCRQNLPWSARLLLSSLEQELARRWEWKGNGKRTKSFFRSKSGAKACCLQAGAGRLWEVPLHCSAG